MKKIRSWVYSGNRPSDGAKELASSVGFLRLRDGRFHKVKPTDLVINWGVSGDFNGLPNGNVLNLPGCVKTASNKLSAFKCFSDDGVSCVDWTDEQTVAQEWSNDERTVVVRNKLTGHSGDGIMIIQKLGEVPAAPLYTRYIFKEREFRVHVVCGKVVDTAKKIKDPDREVKDWKVRSHDNGFIFARNGVVPSGLRDALAISATASLGLDFGAVDIIEDKKGNFYVLEVNTAPGLEGQTTNSYVEAFNGYKSEA